MSEFSTILRILVISSPSVRLAALPEGPALRLRPANQRPGRVIGDHRVASVMEHLYIASTEAERATIYSRSPVDNGDRFRLSQSLHRVEASGLNQAEGPTPGSKQCLLYASLSR